MERRFTATEANQRFSELLRDVESGETVVVTSHGRPVARVVPFKDDLEDQAKRIGDFLDYVKTLPPRVIGPWTREDLYD